MVITTWQTVEVCGRVVREGNKCVGCVILQVCVGVRMSNLYTLNYKIEQEQLVSTLKH